MSNAFVRILFIFSCFLLVAARSPVSPDDPASFVPAAVEDLGLQLVGTVVNNNPRDSLAIIEDRNIGKQYFRREGDRVGKKVVVKKILRNRVIIDAGNGDVILVMGHSQPSGSPSERYQEARGRVPVPASTRFYASVVRG